jgi:hypothetical protein
MTPARLAANRRNALKSTGPRSARGKAQSRMNGLRSGWSSPSYRNLWRPMLEAPPCAVDATARAVLTPEQAAHLRFTELVDIFRQAEIEVAAQSRQLFGRGKTGTKKASASLSEAEDLLKINQG